MFLRCSNCLLSFSKSILTVFSCTMSLCTISCKTDCSCHLFILTWREGQPLLLCSSCSLFAGFLISAISGWDASSLWFFTLSMVVGSTRYFREGCFKTASVPNPSQVVFKSRVGFWLVEIYGILCHWLLHMWRFSQFQWSPKMKTVDVCVSPLPGSTRLIYVYI